MAYKQYNRYMNERSQATPEGAKIHAESVRQIEAVKSFPKRMIKKAVGKIKKVFNRYK